MNTSLTSRIKQNRTSDSARDERHRQADEAIRNHYAAACEQAGRTLAGLLAEQRTLLTTQEYSIDEVGRAVMEEFEHSLKSILHMPRTWAIGSATHYDKANAKATCEYLNDHLLPLAEHMAFQGNVPARPEHTVWDFHRQVLSQDLQHRRSREEALHLGERLLAGEEEAKIGQDLGALFVQVLDQASQASWWQDRVRHLRLHLDRTARFRTMRKQAPWAMDT